MKLTTFLLPILAIALPALAQDNDDDNDNDNDNGTAPADYATNVVEALNGAGLTTLATALTALAATPEGEQFINTLSQGDKTVFAPSNEAFTQLGEGALDNVTMVGDLLAYHIIDEDVSDDEDIGVIPDNSAYDTLRMDDNNMSTPLILTRTSEDQDQFVIYNNNDTISVQGPTEVQNLQVYVIDRVISLPGTLETLIESAGLTTLGSLVGGLTLPSGPVTIFAPTDEAFNAISADLEGLTDEQVNAVLSNHIVNGTVLSEDIIEDDEDGDDDGDDSLTPLAGPAITVMSNDTGVFIMSGDASAQVIATDFLFDGGVVHLINRVLVNQNPEENDQVSTTPGAPSATNSNGPSATGSGDGDDAAQTSNPAEEDSGNPAGKLELSLGATVGGLLVTLGAIAGGGLLAF